MYSRANGLHVLSCQWFTCTLMSMVYMYSHANGLHVLSCQWFTCEPHCKHGLPCMVTHSYCGTELPAFSAGNATCHMTTCRMTTCRMVTCYMVNWRMTIGSHVTMGQAIIQSMGILHSTFYILHPTGENPVYGAANYDIWECLARCGAGTSSLAYP